MSSFLTLLGQSPILALVFLIAVVSAITVHEFSHAWTADRLGDDTPYLQGRVSLNPAAHLDPLGSLLFVLVGFGWGKPVIYNPMRLGRKVDELLIALAGPVSNILFAIFLNLIIHFLPNSQSALILFLQIGSEINVALATFNLLPIPPLDGSSIVAYFWPEYRSLLSSQLGFIILILFIFTGLFSVVLYPAMDIISQITHLFGLL